MSTLDRLLADLAARQPVAVSDPGRPQAAVALLLAPNPDQLLLIRRADRAGDPWSGHLALPGGRRDPADHDLLATAIRETEEEIGLRLDPGSCVATLDDLAPVSPVLPPILVRPFLFRVEHQATFRLSQEVTAVSWVEFFRLTAPGVFGPAELMINGAPRVVQGYHLDEGLLWGMTERILTPVVRRWQQIEAGVAR